MSDLHWLTATELARRIASGDVTPVDAVDAALARIETVQPALNPIAWVRDAARADAEAAAVRLAGGEQPRPLEGVPFTVKELCATEDGPMELGSRAFAGFRAGVDAYVVARLRAAGAILIATTTSSEFGARPTTESALHGPTRNPWDPDRTSGGSSGGAAVAAVTGIAPLNQGSDGGGSVRIPSSCVGGVGLKPTRARISLGPLMAEEWGGFDVYGPLTRSVADAALFLDVTAGPGPGEPYWAPPPADTFLSATAIERPMRVAVAYERSGERIDPACRAAVDQAAALLSDLGHAVEEAQPDLDALEDPFVKISSIGIASQPLTDEQFELLESRTKLIVEVGRALPAVEYTRALHHMHKASREVLRFWDGYDVLVTPTLSKPPPVIGSMGANLEDTWPEYRNFLQWTWPFNCTGQPALTLPLGTSPEGLPIGVQLVGGAADERTILSLGAQIERARPWSQRRPPL